MSFVPLGPLGPFVQDSLEEALTAKRSAEANVDALRSQTKGLEREYDRLLAEHDEVQRRLARAGGGYDKKSS